MEMEGLENNNDVTHNIAKGKRTKRLRLCGVSGAATTVMMTSSCSSANSGGASFSSTTTSTDQEEEDMANCLILLAQGGRISHPHPHHQNNQHDDDDDDDHVDVGYKTEKGNRKVSELATATTATNNNTKVGFYIYECKTCNRTFPSFQALGGHRASHKRLKLMAEEKKPSPPPPSPPQLPHLIVGNYDQFEEAHVKSVPHPISLQLGHKAFHNNNKGKIHECSVCGSEFTSGQALGGHMRRHRASSSANLNTTIDASCNTITTATTIVADTTNNAVSFQPRNILQLDLNLPAPEDDIRVQFTASQKSMVLAGAPALVDCHY